MDTVELFTLIVFAPDSTTDPAAVAFSRSLLRARRLRGSLASARAPGRLSCALVVALSLRATFATPVFCACAYREFFLKSWLPESFTMASKRSYKNLLYVQL